MKRRQALANIFFIIVGAIVATATYKWFSLRKKQNMDLLPSHRTLIAELAEVIIPATDTPGAKDAKVEDFIIKYILNCEDSKEQYTFLTGLHEVRNFTMEKYKCLFQDCHLADKIAVLQHFEDKEISVSKILTKIKTKIFGRPFYCQLKELTVLGYCTSELGATKGLAYDYIPVVYEPCIPLLKSQKSWATK